jgi:multidrug resistance efflux pump
MSSAEKDNNTATTDKVVEQTADPVKRVTKVVLYVVAFIFVWYILADRNAPWTDQARIQTYVIPIVPQVAGRVREVNVEKDQEVLAGDVLLRIDPTDYELAVQRAESTLELAGQDIGASTANVVNAQAELVEAQANLNHMEIQGKRIFEVEKKGVVSKAEGDKARATIKAARAQVDSAKANLEKAKQQLGSKGEKNPKIRKAIAELKQAQVNLERTNLYAPSHGGITNLKIDVGHYASPGVPLMTFVEVDNIWIQANLRENSVANIKVGTEVDIALDSAPGNIYKGSVISLGFAVSHEQGSGVGELATIQGSSGWLRDAQRFPVIIKFDDNSARGYRRLGGQADVQFYGGNWFLNALGWIWIRIMSWVSYVY